jgi:putative transposase
MARRARLVLPGVPLHIIQRGNNRHACFTSDTDYRVYLSMLHEASTASDCAIHAYVLMTNHVHLLLSSGNIGSPSTLMKALGQRYSQYVNRRYGRTGTLWEGRFRSCLVESERYLLTCQRYIELNPVRAAMVPWPGGYQWSSYHANASGTRDSLVTPHELYERLGKCPDERQAAYRQLFDEEISQTTIATLRHATNGNYAMADASFTEWASLVLERCVTPQISGRRPIERG